MAETLGVQVGTLKSRLSRARRRLAERCERTMAPSSAVAALRVPVFTPWLWPAAELTGSCRPFELIMLRGRNSDRLHRRCFGERGLTWLSGRDEHPGCSVTDGTSMS
jgi:hypothetical protein